MIPFSLFERHSSKWAQAASESNTERIIMKRDVDYIGVGVGTIIVDNAGKVFLAKRGEKAKNELCNCISP